MSLASLARAAGSRPARPQEELEDRRVDPPFELAADLVQATDLTKAEAFVQGDTSRTPFGWGTWGSRSAVAGGGVHTSCAGLQGHVATQNEHRFTVIQGVPAFFLFQRGNYPRRGPECRRPLGRTTGYVA